MGERRHAVSGTRWEAAVGYSRAVRIGDMIWVSGTTATGADGSILSEGDAYGQTSHALTNLSAALRAVGADLSCVVRTRIFTIDIDDWDEIGRAHAEVFGTIRPASTMVEVRRLIDPRMIVEIEADAYWVDG